MEQKVFKRLGLVLTSVIAISLASCSNDLFFEFEDYYNASESMVFKDNMFDSFDFLDIKSSNVSEYSRAELQIWNEAIGRLTIMTNKDGLLSVKEKCGAQVNISEKLYCSITTALENGNRIIHPEKYKVRRLKNNSKEGGNVQRLGEGDCVVQTLVHAGASQSSVVTYIDNKYSGTSYSNWRNNGIPSGDVDGIIAEFFNIDSTYGPTQITDGDYGKNYTEINSKSHACSLVSYNMTTGLITVWDAQITNGRHTGLLPKSVISETHMLSNKD